MKFTTLTSLAMVAHVGSAHYFFDKLIINGQESQSKEFVRGNTRKIEYMPTKWKNSFDNVTPDSEDFRCNKGAFSNAAKTKTAEVKAGSQIGMKLALKATMKHPGPAMVYMAKAPTTAKEFQGDGDWFKIFEEGICWPDRDWTTTAWCTWDKDTITFTIPKDTPNGEYLVRTEHIGLHGAHVGEAEFYYECAQIKVVGGGNGKPGPTVKFPGAYKKDDKSFNFSIYGGGGGAQYPMPGPSVWGGGSKINKSRGGGGGGNGGGGGDSGGSGSGGGGGGGGGGGKASKRKRAGNGGPKRRRQEGGSVNEQDHNE